MADEAKRNQWDKEFMRMLAQSEASLKRFAEEQTEVLASYIITNFPGGHHPDEGFQDTAVRLLKDYRWAMRRAAEEIELCNSQLALEILQKALGEKNG